MSRAKMTDEERDARLKYLDAELDRRRRPWYAKGVEVDEARKALESARTARRTTVDLEKRLKILQDEREEIERDRLGPLMIERWALTYQQRCQEFLGTRPDTDYDYGPSEDTAETKELKRRYSWLLWDMNGTGAVQFRDLYRKWGNGASPAALLEILEELAAAGLMRSVPVLRAGPRGNPDYESLVDMILA